MTHHRIAGRDGSDHGFVKEKGREQGTPGFRDGRQCGEARPRQCDHEGTGRIHEGRSYPRCTRCGGQVLPWRKG